MITDTTNETIHYTADVVLFAAGHVLLIERGWDPYEGHWALPGGHVDAGETSVVAAARELEEEAGIAVPAADLRQVGAFDAPGRDPRGRYISVAYTATLPSLVEPTAGDDATAARWWALDGLPDLAFDHAEIIAASLSRRSSRVSAALLRTAPAFPIDGKPGRCGDDPTPLPISKLGEQR